MDQQGDTETLAKEVASIRDEIGKLNAWWEGELRRLLVEKLNKETERRK